MLACSREARSSRTRMSTSGPRPTSMRRRRSRKSRPIWAPRRTTSEAWAFLKRPLSRMALSMAIVRSCGRSGTVLASVLRLDAGAVAAALLGPVEGQVGAADQGDDIPAVRGTGRDADADGDPESRVVQREGMLLDGAADAFRQRGVLLAESSRVEGRSVDRHGAIVRFLGHPSPAADAGSPAGYDSAT